MKTKKRFLGILLSLVMVLGLLPGMGFTAYADVPQEGWNKYVGYGRGNNGFNVYGKREKPDGTIEEIQTTFSNSGYTTVMKVGESEPIYFNDFAYGKEYSSNDVKASVTARVRGKGVLVTYTLLNDSDELKKVKIGSYADTQIYRDDKAPCSFTENGIKMTSIDGTLEFQLIPGGGNFTTRWYGPYYKAVDNVFNNRTDTSTFTDDSGIAWSWTIDIPARATITKTAELSAGQVGTTQIIYDDNGGTGEMDPTVDIPGEPIKLNKNTFTKDDHVFQGWDTNSAGTTVVYADEATLTMPDTDTTLYAVWKANAKAVPATVTANNRTYDGAEQPLVTVDKSTLVGGTMKYAPGTDDQTAPTAGWSESIPTGTEVGTYYVWYKAAGDGDHVDSDPEVVTAVIRLPEPDFDPKPGSYDSPQKVEISCLYPEAIIYYTTDGSDPDMNSKKYSDPIEVNENMTIKAFAVKVDVDKTEIVEGRYYIGESPEPGTYTVSIKTQGNGTASGEIESGEKGTVLKGNTGQKIALTAEPDTGSKFKEWTVDPAGVGTLDGNSYVIGNADVTITAVFEKNIKTLVTLKFEHYQQDGTPGVPKDIPDGLEFTLKLKAKKDGKTYEASAVMDSVEAGNRDSQAEFSFDEELDLSDGYDITLEFSPKTVRGKEIYGDPPIPGKTYTLTVTSLAPTKGKKEEGYCLKAMMKWDDGTRPHNPDDDIAIYALPEDEIGAYVILKDGTKEYLLFHYEEDCIRYLGSYELCKDNERCFHKESPYAKR